MRIGGTTAVKGNAIALVATMLIGIGVASAASTPLMTTNVRIYTPLPKAVIKSPLLIRGAARGSWFFEAVFPIRLLDGRGREVARTAAHAQGTWMTNAFVPFTARLQFKRPATRFGTLVFEKDNPSGLSENAAAVTMPVSFW